MTVDGTTASVRRLVVGSAVVTLCTHVHDWRLRPPYGVSDDELRAAAPDADERARLPLDCTSAHIQLGSASVVVDPGRVTPELAHRYGDAVRLLEVRPALQQQGIDPAVVTFVVITHAHHDHFTGVADNAGLSYPAARHVVSRVEWEGPGLSQRMFRQFSRPAADRGLLDLIDGEVEFGPGFRLIPTPGESPGHLVLRIESRGEVFFWLGDLFHHRLELEHLDWTFGDGDHAALRASRQAILEDAADTQALLVWAHAPDGAPARVARTEGRFQWVPA